MPDTKKPNGDDPAQSGAKIKVAVPHTTEKQGKEFTKVEVDPGTRENTFTVSELHESPIQQDERRKSQLGTQVLIQQAQEVPTGGLLGIPARYLNLTAFGVFVLFAIWFYQDTRSLERERRSEERERWAEFRQDRAEDRSQSQASFAAMTSAVSSLQARNDARDATIAAAIEEGRISRLETKKTQEEMLAVLKQILAMKGGPEEARAPMPRVKEISGEG